MSLTMAPVLIVLSSVGYVSSYAVFPHASDAAFSALPNALDPELACGEPVEDVPPAEYRSVLRSVRRLDANPAFRRLPLAQDRGTMVLNRLPVAPPLPLRDPVPAPIWPSARFLTRSELRSATIARPQEDGAGNAPRADLPPSIRIETSHPAQASVGRTMRLILAVRNTGGTAAGEVRIRTTLPDQAVFVASHPEPSAADPGVLHFDLGTLTAGAVRTIELEVVPHTVGPVEVKTVADFSVVTSSLIHIGRPSLSLTCQAPPAADPGMPVRYRLVVRNTGDGIAEQVVVEPQMSEAADEPPRQRRFLVGDLPPGASREITVRDTARGGDAMLVRFFASDRNGSEAVAEVRVPVRRPAVEITLVGPEEIVLGDQGLFEIRAVNTGTGAVEPVRVACAASIGLRLTVPDQQEQCDTKPGQLSWAIDRLAGGETKTLRFQARPVKAGEQQIRVTVEDAGREAGRARPAAAERTIRIRDRITDDRIACR